MKRNKLILNRTELLETLGQKYVGLSKVISDKFGIINALLERHELDKYNLYMYQCLSANVVDLFDLDREVSSGGLGVSESKKGAMISCLAEAIERYCMSFIPKEEVIYDYLANLNKDRTFSSFFTYNNIQYEKYKDLFSNPIEEKIHWSKIYSITDCNDWKYWPSSLIYLPFNLSKPVAENTSTGMAAGKDIKECISSGLLELIERDALMINFLQELSPPEIDIKSIDGLNKNILNRITKEYNVKIYKLYSDIDVPIYYSLIWKKTKGNIHYGIGASANFNSDYAINKSLKECLFTFFYSRNIMDLKKEKPKDITALYEHFLYYQGDNFQKLLPNSEVVKYTKKVTTFDDVIKKLHDIDIDVYYKDLTTSDIKETNIKVVKVIAPGLIDLNKSHCIPRLGSPRFWSVPQKLNLKYNETLSEKPHPFP